MLYARGGRKKGNNLIPQMGVREEEQKASPEFAHAQEKTPDTLRRRQNKKWGGKNRGFVCNFAK